jgi:hypothetical protein
MTVIGGKAEVPELGHDERGHPAPRSKGAIVLALKHDSFCSGLRSEGTGEMTQKSLARRALCDLRKAHEYPNREGDLKWIPLSDDYIAIYPLVVFGVQLQGDANLFEIIHSKRRSSLPFRRRKQKTEREKARAYYARRRSHENAHADPQSAEPRPATSIQVRPIMSTSIAKICP